MTDTGSGEAAPTPDATEPDARQMLALRCAYEIHAWAVMIAQRVDREEPEAADLWLRGAAIRLDALSSAVITACDPDEPLDAAERVLRGPVYLRAEAG